MVLPSIHAPNDSQKPPGYGVSDTLNAGNARSTKSSSKDSGNLKYTVADIDQFARGPTYDAVGTLEEDFPMPDIQDETGVQVVSRLLSNRRSSNCNAQEEPVSKEDVDSTIPNLGSTKVKSLFVVDTNFLISHLSTLESLRQLAPSFNHQIVVPNTVIRELDGLKGSSREVEVSEGTETIGKLARRANDWIYKNLANLNSGVMGQKLRQCINPDCVKDDAILDCGLYFKETSECLVVLLSNDKNLCMKALTEGLLTVTYKKGMTSELIASMTYNENLSLFGPGDPNDAAADLPQASALQTADFMQIAAEVYREVTAAAIEAVVHVMHEEYGEDIELLGFQVESLTDLAAVSSCLEKFWVSVFAEYFKKSTFKKSDWKSLPNCLTGLPTNSVDLKGLVSFWVKVLDCLYLKRCERSYEILEKASQYWSDLSDACFQP